MAYLGRMDPLSGESAENGRTLSRTLLFPYRQAQWNHFAAVWLLRELAALLERQVGSGLKGRVSKRAQTGIPHSFSLSGRAFVYAAFIYSNSAQVMDSPNAVQVESYAARNAVRPRTSSLQEFAVAPVAPTRRPVCASRRKRDGGM